MKILYTLLLIIAVQAIFAEELFTAKVYKQGSNKSEFLFDYYNTIEIEDDLTILSHYYVLPNKEVATVDQVTLKNNQLLNAKSAFLQIPEVGYIEKQTDKLLMKFERDGKVKQKTIEFPDNLLVGPLFNDYIISKWDELINGKELTFKLPAPNILTAADFTFKQDNRSEFKQDGFVVFRLDPANFFIDLIVKPSYFVYNIAEKKLLEIHGSTILKTKKNGKWKNSTNVDIYFQYNKLSEIQNKVN